MKINKSPRWQRPLLCIAVCVLLTLLASWHAVVCNEGRLVYPMDSYSFQVSDIPMLLAVGLDMLCGVYLVIWLLRSVLRQRRQTETSNRTRRLNPKFGFLGFAGFLGFLGFWTRGICDMYSPFCFFAFFGFFGFFYEGKMSNTLMDERYRENVRRAQLDAYRTGLSILFLLMVFSGMSGSRPEILAVVLLSGISLAMALTLFLSEYLLYRYDRLDAPEEE